MAAPTLRRAAGLEAEKSCGLDHPVVVGRDLAEVFPELLEADPALTRPGRPVYLGQGHDKDPIRVGPTPLARERCSGPWWRVNGVDRRPMTTSAYLSPAGDDAYPTVEVSRVDGRPVVWLRGEHDAFTAAELSEALELALASDHGDVVVDLSGVEFMGTATVAVIMRARECLFQGSRSLAVRSPSSRAQRVLDLCGFGPTTTAG